MNDKFDELAKGMAQSVTRRGALKKFGMGLAGVALASLGLANKAEAKHHIPGKPCNSSADCPKGKYCLWGYCTGL
jgi:hypothetical protein